MKKILPKKGPARDRVVAERDKLKQQLKEAEQRLVDCGEDYDLAEYDIRLRRAEQRVITLCNERAAYAKHVEETLARQRQEYSDMQEHQALLDIQIDEARDAAEYLSKLCMHQKRRNDIASAFPTTNFLGRDLTVPS